ncbi:hypothetical protein D9757_008614 [Collybiopsis confluens]|uniref:Uncharacterized protein n=1 Tax=Collybiopsis confluens TaxID=2823264 RepID=A0A8H5HN30_9AGAR|nr:hypothetical protein D9757_008614 [Collybiopsis confluens]
MRGLSHSAQIYLEQWTPFKRQTSHIITSFMAKSRILPCSMDGCLVKRVAIELGGTNSYGRATTVAFLFDKRAHSSAPQDVQTVRAKQLVIVSARMMGLPFILEHPGIRRKTSVQFDSPGVGAESLDHPFCVTVYHATSERDTFNPPMPASTQATTGVPYGGY